MAPEKLPIHFTDDMLAELDSPESVFACLDFVWANVCTITLSVGDSISLSSSESLFDFRRAKVIVVMSGELSCSETSLRYKAGDCIGVYQWFAATVKAETNTQLGIAQTCANKPALQRAKVRPATECRRERDVSLRLPSASDLAELLTAFQTGLDGQSQMAFSGLCDRFVLDWRIVYHEKIDEIERLHRFSAMSERFAEQCRQALFGHDMLDGQVAHHCLENWLLDELKLDTHIDALTIEPSVGSDHNTPEIDLNTSRSVAHSGALSAGLMANVALFDAPVFIVAAPRSGSTMLFEALKENKDFWTIGDESHQVFESIKELHPAANGFASNRLDATHLDNTIGGAIVGGFTRRLRTNNGQLFTDFGVDQQPSTLRFLEKTPKNALRIPFLKALFPNAKFIFLHRQAEPNIASIMDAWKSGNFVTYPKLPKWEGLPWSLLLCPQWQRFNGKPLAEIAAWQWASTNKQILDDLRFLNQQDWCSISYESILADKASALRSLCEFADVPFGPRMQALIAQSLPQSKYTVSAPNAQKWRKYETDIHQAMTQIGEVAEISGRLDNLVGNSQND